MSPRRVFLLLVIGSFVIAWLTPRSHLELAFVLTSLVGMVVLSVAVVWEMRPKGTREIDLPREEVLAMWDESEPVQIVKQWRHSSTCAVTATGHKGPCTCGAERA